VELTLAATRADIFSSMNRTIYQADISFKIASEDKDFNQGRQLFKEYANSLDIDLCFQGFEEELKTLNIQYNKPTGALLLAYKDNTAFGCVAIREFAKDISELKRMYVKPDFRGYKTGHRLLELILNTAGEMGYKKIRLDTLPDMTNAIKLYRSFGFTEIPSYRFNPIEGVVFMEKALV
jgi:ribosomal protein S18 acetylase RimI-like enzyme